MQIHCIKSDSDLFCVLWIPNGYFLVKKQQLNYFIFKISVI